MVSEKQATDIPVTKVDALHVLRLNRDDLRRLSYEQKSALRKIYFLDDDRSVEERIKDGSITLSPEEIADDDEQLFDRVDRRFYEQCRREGREPIPWVRAWAEENPEEAREINQRVPLVVDGDRQ